MVVPETPPVGHACADAPEAFPDALADRLQGLEAVPALGGMEPDARGRAVIVALPLMGVLVLMTLSFMRWLASWRVV